MFKYIKSTLICIALVIIISPFYSFSQNKKSGEIGASLGGAFYLGEYNTIPFINSKISAGLFYRHTFDTRFAVTGNFHYTTLSGLVEDSYYMTPAAVPDEFNNIIYEFAPVAEFHFIPFLPGKPKKYYYSPYVFAGAMLAYYPSGPQKFIYGVPFGAGLKTNINQRFIFSTFIGIRKTFTDNIDYEYTPPNPSNPIDQWGYSENKDWYSIFGVSLSYKIKYRMKCPAFD